MQYKLIVDKQSRVAPSTDKKTYILDIDELRTNGDISDELIISPNESYVMRRLSLSEYHVLNVLEEPIKEVIENPQIELFEGDNYIYLIDMIGNKFYAEYIIKNDFTDTYPSKIEMNALIELLTQSILLEVSKKVDNEDYTSAKILLMINNDTSEAQIEANKIKLEGYTTINGGFAVDEKGNAKIANGAVKINDDGIQMVDGTSIVGGDGVYTSLSYTGKGMHLGSVVGQGNFQFLGFNCDASLNMYKNYLFIDVFVPENFTLKKAYLSIQHLPIVIGNSSGTVLDYGICSNMKLYKTDVDSQQIYVVPQSDTSITGISNLTEISVLGSSGWTPTKPTSVSQIALEQKNIEIPISNFNTGGKLTRFAVASGASVPTSSSDNLTTIYKNSGAVIATITLIGYLKDIEF